MASHLSIPLGECLSKTTHRQYLVWIRWLEDQWNNPSRNDYYLMQLAAMQTRKSKTGEMRIKFKTRESERPKKPATEAEIVEMKRIKTLESKAAWQVRLNQGK